MGGETKELGSTSQTRGAVGDWAMARIVNRTDVHVVLWDPSPFSFSLAPIYVLLLLHLTYAYEYRYEYYSVRSVLQTAHVQSESKVKVCPSRTFTAHFEVDCL